MAERLKQLVPSRVRARSVEVVPGQLGGFGDQVVVVEENTTDAVASAESLEEQRRELRRKAEEVADLQDSGEHLTHLNLDLRGEYQRPQLSKALEYRSRHHPSDKNGEPLKFCSTDTGSYIQLCRGETDLPNDIIRFGPGLSVYFKWLKLLFCMYATLSLLQLPVIFFNVSAGDYFEEMSLPFSETTLGNLYRLPETAALNASDVPLNTIYRVYAFCGDHEPGEPDPPTWCEVSSGTMLFFYGCMDALTTVVFLIFAFCSGKFARMEGKRFEANALKLESFSLLVENVPDECEPEQLREHFEELTEGEVQDVHLVEASGNTISVCVRRGRLMKKLARADARRKFLGNAWEWRRARADRQYAKLYTKVTELDKMASKKALESKPRMAFVTFESQACRDRALKMYARVFCSFTQATPLRLFGKHPLRVSEAPPPSTLLWENTEVSRASRLARHFATVLAMALLMSTTFAINYVTEPFKLSKSLYESVSTAGSVDDICDGMFAGLATVEEAVQVAFSETEYVIKGRDDLSLLDCLCENALNPTGAAFANGTTTEVLFGTPDGGDGVCDDYFLQRVKDLGLQVIVSFATLVVNTVIFLLLTSTGAFMKFTSIVQREMTILRRLFVATYINTAVLVLVVNTDLQALFGLSFGEDVGSVLARGSFVDFSHEWYRVVGTEIMIVSLLNILAPHAFPLLLAIFNTLYRTLHSPISQSELNEMFLGPEFVLSYRYSQVLMMIFLIMTYSTGLPILYLFGAVSIALTFWVDKYFFTTVSRLPPQLSGRLASWTSSTMPYAAVLHLGLGIWMLSSPFVFPLSSRESRLGVVETLSSSAGFDQDELVFTNVTSLTDASGLSDVLFAVRSRLARDSSIPNLLVLILLILGLVLRNFTFFLKLLGKLHSSISRGLRSCCSSGFVRIMDDLNAEDDAFLLSEAKQAHLFYGIDSYNILANPRYAHAFQLQEEADRAENLADVLQRRAADEMSDTSDLLSSEPLFRERGTPAETEGEPSSSRQGIKYA